jgi:translation initiation factor IF-1
MLIKKNNLSTGDVINIKLISGDEIIGELVDQDDSHYELKKPCIVVTSTEGIGLLQAMFGLDPDKENLVYKNNHVITMCHAHEKMREHYITVTTAE